MREMMKATVTCGRWSFDDLDAVPMMIGIRGLCWERGEKLTRRDVMCGGGNEEWIKIAWYIYTVIFNTVEDWCL